jgi:hypothetical protein
MRGRVPSSIAVWLLAMVSLTMSDGPRVAAQTAAGEKVIGGPYVVNVGQRSATVASCVPSRPC